MAGGRDRFLEPAGDPVSRRHLLIAYDIADERRVKKVQKVVADACDRVQYSVYHGQFSRKDLVILKERLHKVVHNTEDQVLFLDLGPVAEDDDEPVALAVSWLGRPWEPRSLELLIF